MQTCIIDVQKSTAKTEIPPESLDTAPVGIPDVRDKRCFTETVNEWTKVGLY